MNINIKSFLSGFKANKTKTVVYNQKITNVCLEAHKLSLSYKRTKARTRRESKTSFSLKWGYKAFITIII